MAEGEWRERLERQERFSFPRSLYSLSLSQFVKVNTFLDFLPECTRFPFMPNNCHVWIDKRDRQFTLHSRQRGQEYRMDLYEEGKLVHRGIGGMFRFEASLVLVAFTHLMTL